MFTFDLYHRAGWDDALTPAMGLDVDIVGYGRRNTRERQDAQERLHALMLKVLADIGIQLDDLPYGAVCGDNMSLVLPPATDPARALPTVLLAALARLTEDNRRYKDRIRIRMGMDFGLAGRSRLGLIGNLIVDLNRLTDNSTIRQAVANHLDADLVLLISNRLYELVNPQEQLILERVEVVIKEYAAPAWLWVPGEHAARKRAWTVGSGMPMRRLQHGA